MVRAGSQARLKLTMVPFLSIMLSKSIVTCFTARSLVVNSILQETEVVCALCASSKPRDHCCSVTSLPSAFPCRYSNDTMSFPLTSPTVHVKASHHTSASSHKHSDSAFSSPSQHHDHVRVRHTHPHPHDHDYVSVPYPSPSSPFHTHPQASPPHRPPTHHHHSNSPSPPHYYSPQTPASYGIYNILYSFSVLTLRYRSRPLPTVCVVCVPFRSFRWFVSRWRRGDVGRDRWVVWGGRLLWL